MRIKILLIGLIILGFNWLEPSIGAVTKRPLSPRPSIQGLIQSALKLNLNNEQKIKIKAVLESRTDRTNELQEKAIDSMGNYLQLALKADANKNILQKKNKETETAYQTLRNYQLETWLFVRSNLTEQQLQQLSDKQDLAFNSIEEQRKKIASLKTKT